MGLEDKPHLWHDGQGDQALSGVSRWFFCRALVIDTLRFYLCIRFMPLDRDGKIREVYSHISQDEVETGSLATSWLFNKFLDVVLNSLGRFYLV
jgi:hypothetical protein